MPEQAYEKAVQSCPFTAERSRGGKSVIEGHSQMTSVVRGMGGCQILTHGREVA